MGVDSFMEQDLLVRKTYVCDARNKMKEIIANARNNNNINRVLTDASAGTDAGADADADTCTDADWTAGPFTSSCRAGAGAGTGTGAGTVCYQSLRHHFQYGPLPVHPGKAAHDERHCRPPPKDHPTHRRRADISTGTPTN